MFDTVLMHAMKIPTQKERQILYVLVVSGMKLVSSATRGSWIAPYPGKMKGGGSLLPSFPNGTSRILERERIDL